VFPDCGKQNWNLTFADLMQHLELSVALVRRTDQGATRWLAQINSANHQLNFIIADRLIDESFRETTTREVAWRLELDRHRDFLVSNMAQLNLEFVDCLPGQSEETQLMVSFYNVEIYRAAALSQLDANPKNRWVSSQEICRGGADDGKPFDELLRFLIGRSNVIQHWESTGS